MRITTAEGLSKDRLSLLASKIISQDSLQLSGVSSILDFIDAVSKEDCELQVHENDIKRDLLSFISGLNISTQEESLIVRRLKERGFISAFSKARIDDALHIAAAKQHIELSDWLLRNRIAGKPFKSALEQDLIYALGRLTKDHESRDKLIRFACLLCDSGINLQRSCPEYSFEPILNAVSRALGDKEAAILKSKWLKNKIKFQFDHRPERGPEL